MFTSIKPCGSYGYAPQLWKGTSWAITKWLNYACPIDFEQFLSHSVLKGTFLIFWQWEHSTAILKLINAIVFYPFPSQHALYLLLQNKNSTKGMRGKEFLVKTSAPNVMTASIMRLIDIHCVTLTIAIGDDENVSVIRRTLQSLHSIINIFFTKRHPICVWI